jgi:hypothetical protein
MIRPPLALGVGALALLVAGCSDRTGGERLVLGAADFAERDAPVVITLPTDPPQTGRPVATTRGPVPGAPLPIVARPGAPEGVIDPASPDAPVSAVSDTSAQTTETARDPAPIAGEVLIEAKVGDINGRPVYADAFLEPLSGRLSAEAARMPRSRWVAFAREQIDRELYSIVSDELLRAEALSTLTAPQKQNLRGFIQSLRGELASQNYGSSALAARSLDEGQGLTEEEYLAQREASLLVQETIRTRVSSRVQVSWRDIRQRYDRDRDEYQTPPIARFRLVRVASDEALEEVRRRLASGEPFASIARSDLNLSSPDTGGLQVFEFSEPFEEAEFYGNDAMNDAARTLTPGNWAGPIGLGRQWVWVYLVEIEETARTLYEAQLEIEAELRSERQRDELLKFQNNLLGRVSNAELQELRNRILRIAIARYGPSA